MATDSIEICNSALIKAGADTITALSDSNKRARLCNERYAKKLKALVYSHPWNFATKRVALVDDGNTPLWDFTQQYDLPSDYLRVLSTNLLVSANWKVEGLKFLCNDSAVNIKYLYNIIDTTLFSAAFDEAIAYDIAREISYALTQSNSRVQQLNKDFKLALSAARSFDAQEGTIEQVEAYEWNDARY